MSHAFKPSSGMSARGGNNIILQRPKMAALLGAICSVWGEADNLFANIFNLITFAKIDGIAHSKSKLSDAIFDSHIAIRSKSEAIRKILKLRYPEEVAKDFENIAEFVRKKAKQRNTVVHASWNISDNYPDDLIITGDPEWIRYTEEDFQNILNVSNEAKDKLIDFFVGLSRYKRLDI